MANQLCKVEVKRKRGTTWTRILPVLFCVRDPSTRLCPRNVSKDAIEEYMKQRYILYNSCAKPCTVLNIQTTLVSKSETSKSRVMFMFGKTVTVSTEILARTSEMQKAADISDLFFLSWCWFWNYANMHQCYQHHGTKGLKNRVDRNPGKPLLSQLDCSLNSLIAWQTYNLLKSDFSDSP